MIQKLHTINQHHKAYINRSHVAGEDRPRLPVHVMAVAPVVVLPKSVDVVRGEARADL